MIARPTVAEERALVLAGRYPALGAAIVRMGLAGRWKSPTWLARCLGFALALVGVSLLGGMLWLFPSPLFTGGLLLLVAAEWLIARRHVLRAGFEEAMMPCGAVAVAAQLLRWSGADDLAPVIAIVSTAVLLVGWRLLNPLFTTLAAAGWSLAIAVHDATLFGGSANTRAAAIACVLLAIAALVAGRRTWQRPSHDRMLDGLAIAMPWLAYGWLVAGDRTGGLPQWVPLVLALGLLAATATEGLRRRSHALLIGALGNLACALHAVYGLLGWPAHWRLIAIGTLVLAVAVLLERLLRHGPDGFSSRDVGAPDGLDLLRLAAMTQVAPTSASAAPPPAGVHGQGGEFGGGGASGRF